MADILVADDDPILMEILKMHQKGAGRSVSVARNGEEALSRAREDRPDLIVLDSIMPIVARADVLAE